MRSSAPSDAGKAERSRLESLDARLWLLGDVRLDDPGQLRRRLLSGGASQAASANQARLCLLAYERWEEGCVDHIAGDFAFVVWDDRRQCLFAASDRLGKRALFHGRSRSLGVVGSSLDWVAAQAAPGGELDEYWIADFLTQGETLEAHRTVWRDVARLEPAHVLRLDDNGAERRRYWRLEVPEPLYLPRAADYLERFRELTLQAVADRLSPTRTGIAMSGGLDSTTLAACAVRLAGKPGQVTAYCAHYENMPGLDEGLFAQRAADHLGIELRLVASDDMAYDPDWQTRGIRSAQPQPGMVSADPVRRFNDSLAAQASVWFEGEGPDNALRFERDKYLAWLKRRRAWRQLAGALFSYTMVKGRRGWLETLGRHARGQSPSPSSTGLPRWVHPDLVERLHLPQRIDDLAKAGDPAHPWHPDAIGSFTSPVWQVHFASWTFEESLSPIQWRHPFLDLRVLEFMLAVPPIPWAWNKALVRQSMREWLPSSILDRPKAPLPHVPTVASVARHGLPRLMAAGAIEPYVNVARLPAADAAADDVLLSLNTYVLDHWLATRA